jgi:Flp pilus assembly protein TadD
MLSQYDPNLSPKFTEATRLLQAQKFPEAIALLENLTQEKPAVAEYWFALGIAYAANNNPQAALDPLDRACKASPRPPRACYHYGRILQGFNRHADAVAAFSAAGRNAEDSSLLSAKAESLEQLNNIVEADHAYRAALAESALRPRNSAAIQLRYSQFLIRAGKFEAALWQLEQCIRKQPFEGLAWRTKAIVLIQLDRKAEAADALEQAIAHGQRNRENLSLLSRIYLALGDKEKAESYRLEADPPR